ncbi:5030_t:CDS:1, partial [Dentiscutata erythropus]
MAQTIFNHLNNNQKTLVKKIYFEQNTNQPSLSGDTFNIPDYPNNVQLKGQLD